MRFALYARIIFVLATVALAIGCGTQTGPDDPDLTGSGCVSDFACPSGMECGSVGCETVAPSIYPHIQTASAFFRNYHDNAESDFRATHYDLLINHVVSHTEVFRAINPNVRMFEYINIRYNRYDEEGNTATNWALAHHYDPEDFYLHYREDTDVPGWENTVLVSGYPPGRVPGWNPGATASDPPASATTRSESRAYNYYDGLVDPFYMANIENTGLRRFLVDFIASLVDGTHYNGAPFPGGPIDGVMADNAVYYAQFGEGVLPNTSEYYGMAMDPDHPYAHGFETLYPELAVGLEAHFGHAIDLMPNFGHALFLNYNNPAATGIQETTPWAWAEVWLMYHGYAQPTSGSLRCITWERDYENAIAAIARETRNGARRVLGARDKPLDNGPGSDRGRIYLLALYYLVHNQNTWLAYETVNGHAGAGDISTWAWNPAVAFDIGAPEPIPANKVDFDGHAGTTEHFVFAEGSDPYRPDLTYRVLARNFTNALVLAKMLPDGSVVSDASITTHALGASYMPLLADGTLGPAISSVSLRNNEGAILIPVN